jgi:Transmembrane domain of unknown function (DUF3566)
MTSRHDDDGLVTDDDQDTRPTGIMAPPRNRTVAQPAPATQDASANGGPAADGAENSGLPGAGTDVAAADAVPALPADGIGHALDPADSTLSFNRPTSAPVPPAADDWVPGPDGERSPDGSLARDASAPADPYPGSLAGTTSLHAAPVTEPSMPDPSPTTPSATDPSPGTVSAAAFAWETPGPAPAPPSSPARNFLRADGNAKAAAATGAAAAAVGSASTQADRAAEPARGKPKRSSRRQARQAHLTVARIEPWSVMKFSFVVSLVAFVILFVAVSVLYGSLSALGVFDSLQRVVTNVTSSQDSAGVNAAKWFTASKVLGYTALLGSLNIVLITAMATIGAVVYNLTSRLIGGVEVTLRETE